MIKFNKDLNLIAVSLMVSFSVLSTSMALLRNCHCELQRSEAISFFEIASVASLPRNDISKGISQQSQYSEDSLRVPVGQETTYERIIGAMHSGSIRFEALKRLLQMKGIDIEVWANEQQGKMTPDDKVALLRALKAIGLTETQIGSILDRIILCEIPQEIRLEGKGKGASRIGGVIVKTRGGIRSSFLKIG